MKTVGGAMCGIHQNPEEEEVDTSQIFRKFISTSSRTDREENMELFVVSPNLRCTNLTVAPGSTVSDLIDQFAVKEVSDQ